MDRTHEERLAPLRDRMAYVIAHPVTEDVRQDKPPVTPGVTISDRWSWCDALYMAPPTLTRLYAATGDRKFLDFLDREYRSTYDHLYDPAGICFSATPHFSTSEHRRKENFLEPWQRLGLWRTRPAPGTSAARSSGPRIL